MVRLENQGGDLTLEVEFCLIYRQTSSHVSIIQKNRTTLVPGSFQQFFDPSQEPLILTNLLTPSLRDGVLKSFLRIFESRIRRATPAELLADSPACGLRKAWRGALEAFMMEEFRWRHSK